MKNMKNIRYWKIVGSNFNMKDASTILTNKRLNDVLLEDLAIRIGNRIFIDHYGFESSQFSPKESLSDKWEIIVPDTGMEEKLENLRTDLKRVNFLSKLGINYKKIDNMDANEIFNAVVTYFQYYDDEFKIRLVKKIIDNQIYKKQ